MAAEHETVSALAQMEMTRRGARVFANSMGMGIVGTVVEEYNGERGHVITVQKARRVRFGLCNPGGSDLIGWRPLKITYDMVGQTVAQFMAVECKTAGYNTCTPAQSNFLAQVARAGGVAVIARREGDGVTFDEMEK